MRLREAARARAIQNSKWRSSKFPPGIKEPPNLDKPKVWADTARSALTLDPRDKALKKVFEKFSLDPDDPRSWRELVNVLVEVLAPELSVERKRAGNKKKWTLERRIELVQAVDRIKRESSGKLSDEQACKKLIRQRIARPIFAKPLRGR